jgi:hypothetical protein
MATGIGIILLACWLVAWGVTRLMLPENRTAIPVLMSVAAFVTAVFLFLGK